MIPIYVFCAGRANVIRILIVVGRKALLKAREAAVPHIDDLTTETLYLFPTKFSAN